MAVALAVGRDGAMETAGDGVVAGLTGGPAAYNMADD